MKKLLILALAVLFLPPPVAPVATTTHPLYGDVDGDGVIDAADITLLRRYIAAEDKDAFLLANPRFNLENADVNGDRIICAADVARLRQYVAGYANAHLGPPLPADAIVFSIRPAVGTPETLAVGDNFTMEIHMENPAGKSIGSISYLGIYFNYDVVEWNLTGEYAPWLNMPFRAGDVPSMMWLALNPPSRAYNNAADNPHGNINAYFNFDSIWNYTGFGGVLLALDFTAKVSTSVPEFILSLANMTEFMGDTLIFRTDYGFAPGTSYVTNAVTKGDAFVLFSTALLFGDADSNGVIDSADITMLRRYISAELKDNFMRLNPRFNLANADADGNGIISAADVARLRQYVAGFPVPLGPLNATPLTWNAPPGGSSIPVVVSLEQGPFQNASWNVMGGGWLSAEPNNGNGSRSFTLRADPNTTTSARSGSVVINAQLLGGIVSRTVTVTQQPMPRVNFTFNLQGGTFNGSTSNVVISSIPGFLLNRPSPNPTRSGHTFYNWYTSAAYTTLAPTNAPASPATYHARWNPISATDVTVSPSQYRLDLGEQLRFGASVSPSTASQSVTWSSGNTSIATVNSSGWVTGERRGVATITARSVANPNIFGTALITVIKPVTVDLFAEPVWRAHYGNNWQTEAQNLFASTRVPFYNTWNINMIPTIRTITMPSWITCPNSGTNENCTQARGCGSGTSCRTSHHKSAVRIAEHSLTLSTRDLSLVLVGHGICDFSDGAHTDATGELAGVGFRGGKGAVSRGYHTGGSWARGHSHVTNAEVHYWNTVRTMQHELSHNYGADHCDDLNCIMHEDGLWGNRTNLADIWCSSCKTAMRAYADSF